MIRKKQRVVCEEKMDDLSNNDTRKLLIICGPLYRVIPEFTVEDICREELRNTLLKIGFTER